MNRRRTSFGPTQVLQFDIKNKMPYVTQAVSRWLPTAAALVRVRAEHVGFVVDKVVTRRSMAQNVSNNADLYDSVDAHYKNGPKDPI
jgi:molybdate-binding protein